MTTNSTTETIKDLLSESEWNELKSIIEGEDKQIIENLQKELKTTVAHEKKLRASVGKLYGHFTAVMRFYDISPITQSGKEVSLDDKPQPPIVQRLQSAINTQRQQETKANDRTEPADTNGAAQEVRWRRQVMENQIRQEPSCVNDIIKRLKKDGFPVNNDHYSFKVKGTSGTRLRACLHADLHLLFHNGAIRKEEGNYVWVTNVPNRYSKPSVLKGNGVH